MAATPATPPSPVPSSAVSPSRVSPSPVSPSPVMSLLHDGLPLTLLLDLALGVRSAEVYSAEQADLSWLPQTVAGAC